VICGQYGWGGQFRVTTALHRRKRTPTGPLIRCGRRNEEQFMSVWNRTPDMWFIYAVVDRNGKFVCGECWRRKTGAVKLNYESANSVVCNMMRLVLALSDMMRGFYRAKCRNRENFPLKINVVLIG
jgi:hypothetical protein